LTTNPSHKAKKRDEKAARQTGDDNISQSSVSISKYSVGSKLPSGAVVKEVNEKEWEFVKKEGKYYFYHCLACTSKKEVRKDNRKTHLCLK
jgi:hypothetical protein